MIGFNPDGAWGEGTGYLQYTMSYLTKGLGAIMSSFGTDFGLTRANGFSETADFFVSMSGICGINNYHDTDRGKLEFPYFGFLGNVFNRPAYNTLRYNQIKENDAKWITPYDFIWNNLSSRGDIELPAEICSKGLESIGIRDCYGSASNLYFSAHGGMVSGYHCHADAGSFVFDALGERWCDDLGKEDYNVQRDGSEGFYSSYRRRAEAHNTVVINPNSNPDDGGQELDAFVPLTAHKTTPYGSLVVYDMTEAYKSYANSYQRKFLVDKSNSSLVIGDYINLKNQSEIDWFLTTGADITKKSDNRFELSLNGKKMYGKIEVTGGSFSYETTDCAPLLGAPVLENQNKNEGFKRLRIKTNGSGKVSVRVTLSPNRSYSVFDDCCRISGVSASNAGENNVNITVSGAWGKQAKDFLLLVAEKKSDGTLINAEKFLITPPICEESLDLEGNEFICSRSYEKKRNNLKFRF